MSRDNSENYGWLLVPDGSSGNIELEREMASRMMRAFDIFKERQKKYGCGNIAKRGPMGILVRMDDKLARLDNTVQHGAGESADESVTDTCFDVANYALILDICRAGKWPGWEPNRG